MAVLGRGVLLREDGFTVPVALPQNAFEAHELARRCSVRQLWFTREALTELTLPEKLDARSPMQHRFLDDGGLKHPSNQTSLAPWLSFWNQSHYVELSFPSWDASSPFHALTAPELVLGEVGEFVEATGTLWQRSGAITSDAWLRNHYGDKLKVADVPPPGENRLLEPDASWSRPLVSRSERAGKFLHAFDINAMYLGAASSLVLPTGPVEELHERISPMTAPGYWRYGGAFLTTPTVRLRDLRSADPGSFMWNEWHRYLEPWYRMLRDARTHLMQYGPSPALSAVKQVYTMGVGRFASTRRSTPNDPLYQPYWRHAVMAEARCRLERRLAQLRSQPVAVDVDCAYFLSNREDPLAYAKWLGLPLGEGIGQWKYMGSMEGKAARSVLVMEHTAMVRALHDGVAA